MKSSRRNPAELVFSLLVAAVIVVLAGCSVPAPRDDPGRAEPAPDFHGPWAESFNEAWKASQTDGQRAILADENVTASENLALQSEFSRCLHSAGVAITRSDEGAFSASPGAPGRDPRSVAQPVSQCEQRSTGLISSLYYQSRSNPDNRDVYELMAACLVREHIVEQGYSAADYRRDFESDSFDGTAAGNQFSVCSSGR
jgi:hypothetical protein